MSPLNEQENLSNQLDKAKSSDWIDGYFAVWVGIFAVLLITVVFSFLLHSIPMLAAWVFGPAQIVESKTIELIVGAGWLWFVIRFLFPVGIDFGKLSGFWAQKLAYVDISQVLAVIRCRAMRMVNDALIIRRLFSGRN